MLIYHGMYSYMYLITQCRDLQLTYKVIIDEIIIF